MLCCRCGGTPSGCRMTPASPRAISTPAVRRLSTLRVTTSINSSCQTCSYVHLTAPLGSPLPCWPQYGLNTDTLCLRRAPVPAISRVNRHASPLPCLPCVRLLALRALMRPSPQPFLFTFPPLHLSAQKVFSPQALACWAQPTGVPLSMDNWRQNIHTHLEQLPKTALHATANTHNPKCPRPLLAACYHELMPSQCTEQLTAPADAAQMHSDALVFMRCTAAAWLPHPACLVASRAPSSDTRVPCRPYPLEHRLRHDAFTCLQP